MALIFGRDMGLRVGQLAGAFIFVLTIGRLGHLLLSGPEQPQWNMILVAAAFLGGVAWWLLGQLTSHRWVRLGLFIAAGIVLVIRISAPATLAAGVLPTSQTLTFMGEQFSDAFRVIQSGVPPVSSSGGLLAILAFVMWVIGALYTWGCTGGPYAALFVPSLVMYLQFAVFDRQPAGLGWLAASGIALGLCIVSMALEKRGDTGRVRDSEGIPLGHRSVGLASVMAVSLIVGAVVVANNASALVNEYGNAPWRGTFGGGYGEGGGGVRFDRLVDLRQQVIGDDDTPVFEVTVGPGAPPASEMYFRMETLDRFDGENWRRSEASTAAVQASAPIASADDIYQGPNRNDFIQNVRIRGMTTDVVPTAGVPVAVLEPQGSGNQLGPTDFLYLNDAALIGRVNLKEDDTYTVRTVQPVRNADLGILATGDDGEFTPLFAAAAEAGAFQHEPGTVENLADAPVDLEFYEELPSNMPPSIPRLAREVTRGAVSDFERAWLLQSFFRDGERFVYDDEVSTGHSSLILAEWLSDPTSTNYRTGYCEQFAAAMAVMARSIGIPTRVVWGFTPGTVETQGNGQEIIVVGRRNAHAWVEVWLDQVGWTAFDPTPRAEQTGFAGQPPSITAGFDPTDYISETTANPDVLEPPVTGPNLGEDPELLDDVANPLDRGDVRWWLVAVILAGLAVALIPVMKKLRRRRRLARLRNGDITAAWDEIVDRLTDLGVEVGPSLTPLEVARGTDPALVPLAMRYSASIYGGKGGQAREEDLYDVEWWIDRTFDGKKKTRAALSLKSLLPGNDQ